MKQSPEKTLIEIVKKFPTVWKVAEQAFFQKGKELPNWPSYCYFPMAGWYASLCNHYRCDRLSVEQAGDISKVAALGAWRYTQGVYRFSEELYQSLLESKFNGNIPCDVLLRLPQWCVYIETPDLSFKGFWAHIEVDANTNQRELRVLMDDDMLTPLILHIGNWMLYEGIEKFFNESEKYTDKNVILNRKNNFLKDIEKVWEKIIPLILYLCSEEPDILNKYDKTSKPTYCKPEKTKTGPRLFPSASISIWEVGEEIQTTIRKARSQADYKGSSDNTRSLTPHIRKAHWHGYWIGPKIDQKFIFKWMPPILVSANN